MSLVYRSFLAQRTGYSLAAAQDVLALSTTDLAAELHTSTLTPGVWDHADLHGRAGAEVTQRHARSAWRDAGLTLLRSIPTDAVAPIDLARSDQGFPAYFRLDQKVVCLTVFEAENWPAGWVTACNAYDAIVVPNDWLAAAARAQGVTVPVHVVPHALDGTVNGADAREVAPALPPCEAWFEPPVAAPRVRVLAEGTYMLRKNLIGAVEAFYRAFGAKGGAAASATLLLHTSFFHPLHRALLLEQIVDLRRQLAAEGFTAFPPLLVSTATLPWPRLWAMYRWASVYLTLAHAEGVGYPLLFAGVLGLPVVASDHPAHRDSAPQATFVPTRPATPGELAATDPLSTKMRFHIAHVGDEDRWRAPDARAAADRLDAVARGGGGETACEAVATVRARHGIEAVGAQLAAVCGAVGGA